MCVGVRSKQQKGGGLRRRNRNLTPPSALVAGARAPARREQSPSQVRHPISVVDDL